MGPDVSEHDTQPQTSPGAMSDAHVFLFGADMDPVAVRAAYPGARFVARARIPAGPGEDPWHPAGDPANWLADERSQDVWGILLQLPAPAHPPIAPLREVVTDDRRRFEAFVGTDGSTVGDPPAVVAQARYWELPPAYVARLQAAFAAGSELEESEPESETEAET